MNVGHGSTGTSNMMQLNISDVPGQIATVVKVPCPEVEEKRFFGWKGPYMKVQMQVKYVEVCGALQRRQVTDFVEWSGASRHCAASVRPITSDHLVSSFITAKPTTRASDGCAII